MKCHKVGVCLLKMDGSEDLKENHMEISDLNNTTSKMELPRMGEKARKMAGEMQRP